MPPRGAGGRPRIVNHNTLQSLSDAIAATFVHRSGLPHRVPRWRLPSWGMLCAVLASAQESSTQESPRHTWGDAVQLDLLQGAMVWSRLVRAVTRETTRVVSGCCRYDDEHLRGDVTRCLAIGCSAWEWCATAWHFVNLVRHAVAIPPPSAAAAASSPAAGPKQGWPPHLRCGHSPVEDSDVLPPSLVGGMPTALATATECFRSCRLLIIQEGMMAPRRNALFREALRELFDVEVRIHGRFSTVGFREMGLPAGVRRRRRKHLQHLHSAPPSSDGVVGRTALADASLYTDTVDPAMLLSALIALVFDVDASAERVDLLLEASLRLQPDRPLVTAHAGAAGEPDSLAAIVVQEATRARLPRSIVDSLQLIADDGCSDWLN